MPQLSVRSVTLRGVPIWRLREYLEALGAVAEQPSPPGPADPDAVVRPHGAMRGHDWQVVWRTETRPFHPRLNTTIEEHHFTFSAPDQPTLEIIFNKFMQKAHRGGG